MLLDDSSVVGREGTELVVEEVDMLIKPAIVVSEELWEIILRIVCSEVFASAPRSAAFVFVAAGHAYNEANDISSLQVIYYTEKNTAMNRLCLL